jgi:hypothetical protein
MKTTRPMPTHHRRPVLAFLGALGVTACGLGLWVASVSAGTAPLPSQESPVKIRLIVGEQVATATLYDNATARDFASLLPLSLTMSDYDTIERVADLPRKLSTQGAPDGMTPVAGELTHYAPWGNLAIFVQPRSYSHRLLPLGKVDEGLSVLAQHGPCQVRIERVGS